MSPQYFALLKTGNQSVCFSPFFTFGNDQKDRKIEKIMGRLFDYEKKR